MRREADRGSGPQTPRRHDSRPSFSTLLLLPRAIVQPCPALACLYSVLVPSAARGFSASCATRSSTLRHPVSPPFPSSPQSQPPFPHFLAPSISFEPPALPSLLRPPLHRPDLVGSRARALPRVPGLLRAVRARGHLHAVAHHKGAVETHTELAWTLDGGSEQGR